MTRPVHKFLLLTASLLLICQLTDRAQCQSVEENEVEALETHGAAARNDDVDPEQVVQLIIDQTNTFRESEGLPQVEQNSDLTAAAEYFAQYMARTDRYGHSADGKRPSQRASNHGYDFCLIAENIAYRYNSTGSHTQALADQFVEGWKNSPKHRDNMLNPDVRDTGVAVAQSDTTGHWYAVQMFGRPESAAIEFRISNQSRTDVSYTIGKRIFQLPPRYTRTHMSCRTSPVTFDFPGPDSPADQKIQPHSGDRFAVVREGDSLRIEQEQ